MVTKRARLWLRRGAAVAGLVIVAVLGGATWSYTGEIDAELLSVPEPRSGPEDRFVAARGPSDVGIPHVEVLVAGPLGSYPAWQVAGVDDTWVVFVHGRDADRREAVRAMTTVHRLGLPMLVVSYRNDVGAPSTDDRRYALGDDEWRDLEAAIIHALREGARDVVLVGYGMGGAISATFLHESELGRRVVGLVFDAPLLDPGVVVDADAAERGVPGFLAGWAKALATFRFGIDWTDLDQVGRAAEFDVPILLFHGDADDVIPIRSSEALAAARPDVVRFELFAGAGHGAAWNVDPDRYDAALARFLDDVAVGDSELPRIDVDR